MFAGHLVTNQPLTEAKGSSCHSYCAGHSRTRVTLWSPWASGPQRCKRGWAARGSGTHGMLSSPGTGPQGRICLQGASCPLSSEAGVWRGQGTRWGTGGVGPSLPSSALEAARADSGCRFLLGHRRALSVSRRSGAWLEIVAHGGAPQWVVYGEKGRPHLSWALCFARCLGGPLGIAPQEPVTAHALPHPCVLHPRPRARTHSLPLRNKAPSV